MKTTIDESTNQRFHAILDELALPLTADASSVRRLHDAAKAITALADSIGRHKHVDFDEVWPQSMADKSVGSMCLPLSLGLTSTNEKLVADLASLPHLLVGGAMGQGKSNLLNSILCGLTRLLPPDELRLVLVDTKMVEFTPYAALPHLAFPIITDDNKCLNAFRWLVAEMERRLKLFARAQCRNIQSYRESGNAIPYIVVIIDEFADLMLNYGKDFEPVVARLTAMARAAGIHLVMATQRADNDVLSGTIRCNIPGRIAFKTRSQSESRRIIDSPDADILCAPGDMLVRQKDGSLVRAQCAYSSAVEECKIIEELTSRYPHPAYLAEIPDVVPEAENNQQQGKSIDAKMYENALEIVLTTRCAQTSNLMCKMGIGYNVALRLLDTLEDNGIVGPSRGVEPREILVP